MVRICICGGGSLGHVCAGVLASHEDVEVNVLTRNPEKWSHSVDVIDLNGKKYIGKLNCVTNDPQLALFQCDIVFLCLPGFAIEETLISIRPYINQAVVGSIVCSTGFFFVAHKVLSKDTKLFGFQRVPFIARLIEYGKSVSLLGYKPKLAMATENILHADSFCRLVQKLWLTPTELLSSYYEASLTNSNPILHTGRLYSLWKDWDGEVFDRPLLFYKEWTIEASQILIEMDKEFMSLLNVLPVNKGSIPSLLEYYDSFNAESLCKKISSIPAFQDIKAPMKAVDTGWIPDFKSRYFTEDFPYGLRYIKSLASQNNIPTPMIDKVYDWGMKCCLQYN